MNRPDDATPPLPPDVRARSEAEEAAAFDEAWRLASLAAPSEAPAPSALRKAATWSLISAATRPEAAPARRTARRPARRLGQPALALWGQTRTALAATALLLFLTSAGLWSLLRPTTLTAPPGRTLTAILPDGSHVELSSGAALTYPRALGEAARRVRLEGEAFFDVTHGDRPFIVQTFNADVTVLGTQFNVRAWPERAARRTSVAVVSGSVRVEARSGEAASVTLGPGQQSYLAADATEPVAPQPVTVGEATAWRDGTFTMIDQPLGIMFDEIERRFNVRITASPDVRARRWSITKHPPMTPEALLRDLCVPNALRFRPTADGFEVLSEG